MPDVKRREPIVFGKRGIEVMITRAHKAMLKLKRGKVKHAEKKGARG